MATQTRPMTLGQALREETASRGWSQREAAEHIGVSQQAFSRWAKGKGAVQPQFLPAVARFLKLKRDEVARLALAPPPDPDEARLRRIERLMGDQAKEIRLLREALEALLARLDRDA